MPDPRKILIIDDERDFCDLLVLMFKREPFDVECAYTLKEALKKLKKEHPAIVLLDHNLPDGRGLDFYVDKKEQFDEAKIFLMTADPSREIQEGAREAGIEFLAKPFGLKKIKDIVRSAG
jgi:DNA-binding response OmpR family regulator